MLLIIGAALATDGDMNASAGTPHSSGSPCQIGLLLAQQLWYLPREDRENHACIGQMIS